MTQIIKFPTLITDELSSHHTRYEDMRTDVGNIINNYNNRGINDKLHIPYRGKSKKKVIKHINYDSVNIGDVPTIRICVEEYKEGYDDLYHEQHDNGNIQTISSEDKLGSDRNYALLYPFIDGNNNRNRWLVVIYDTPNKDDNDIITTISWTIKKIFEFPCKNVMPSAFNGIPVIPKIEVSYVNVENEENENIVLHEHVIRQKVTTKREIEYNDVPTEDLDMILNEDFVNEVPGLLDRAKRRIKIFFDRNNKSNYKCIDQKVDDNGNISSLFSAKYSYKIAVSDEEAQRINNNDFMVHHFSEVITNYLTNGDNQNG